MRNLSPGLINCRRISAQTKWMRKKRKEYWASLALRHCPGLGARSQLRLLPGFRVCPCGIRKFRELAGIWHKRKIVSEMRRESWRAPLARNGKKRARLPPPLSSGQMIPTRATAQFARCANPALFSWRHIHPFSSLPASPSLVRETHRTGARSGGLDGAGPWRQPALPWFRAWPAGLMPARIRPRSRKLAAALGFWAQALI